MNALLQVGLNLSGCTLSSANGRVHFMLDTGAGEVLVTYAAVVETVDGGFDHLRRCVVVGIRGRLVIVGEWIGHDVAY